MHDESKPVTPYKIAFTYIHALSKIMHGWSVQVLPDPLDMLDLLGFWALKGLATF